MIGARDVLRQLFKAAVEAVAPEALVTDRLEVSPRSLTLREPDGSRRVFDRPACVLGVGKAAARMALGVERAGGEALSGQVLVADGCGVPLRTVTCSTGGHPLPDTRGMEASARILGAAAAVSPAATVLVLVSGGASSLFVQPAPPLSLADKIAVNRLLLECGAAIAEVNTVRKHLSLSKGGGLARTCPGRVVSLIISDVIGDDPAVVASGPTAADPSTYADALEIVTRRGILGRIPATARRRLEAGVAGTVPETLKPGDPVASRTVNVVIGSNCLALGAAAAAAGRLGYDVSLVPAPIDGETRAAAHRFADQIALAADRARTLQRPVCLLAGGETTVRVTGSGKGGRNQEFALCLADAIAGKDIAILSAGSDGIDGPTDAAGAFADGTTAARARQAGLDAASSLARNDSYAFFDTLADLFRPGPTGTNVMDFKFALVGPIP